MQKDLGSDMGFEVVAGRRIKEFVGYTMPLGLSSEERIIRH
jgi:hypothetical protein